MTGGGRQLGNGLRPVYEGKRVLVTGHTGFKGGWLTLWLAALGAHVTGYALPPQDTTSLFGLAEIGGLCRHVEGDVRDRGAVNTLIADVRPDFIFHLAAQPLVRESYARPVETLETNVLGTANLLDAVRVVGAPCTVIVVTTDKCYENQGWDYGYREEDRLGGHDPYSMSKAACELVVSSYRRSFFPPERLAEHGVALASARAGNVIGGGDWAADRIVPDAIRALINERSIQVRNPGAVRPWQHVLEALGGYLQLARRMARREEADASEFCGAWNFGPATEQTRTVREVVEAIISGWGSGSWESVHETRAVHEAPVLRLSIDKAWARLRWAPRWGFDETLGVTTRWYKAWHAGATATELRGLCLAQIDEYSS